MRIKDSLRRMATCLAGLTLAAVMVIGSASSAWAADKIHLKDGRVIEGTIVRELNGSVWVDYQIGGITQRGAFFSASAIDKIERDAASEAAPAGPVKAERESASKTQAKRPGVQRAVVITLEGMVGMQFAAKPLEDAIPWLEANEVDIVVLKINSGGGYLLEIPKMHEVLVDKYKKKFRTVAWIESAISAAAMSSHVLEEIYFMTDGNYGACTGWSGALEAVEGYGLEKVLYMMEQASAEGKKDFKIMRSMQIDEPLSYNRDSNGNITWYNTEEGEVVVNSTGKILTFDAVQAARCKFSKGIADNLQELERLLGVAEIEWMGKPTPGEIFPISGPEADMRTWRDSVTDAEQRLGEYMTKYNLAVQNAAASPDLDQRGAFVGLARRHLAVIKRAVREHPNIGMLNGLTDEWFREQEKMLRDLMRP